jgi:hypothetical protein
MAPPTHVDVYGARPESAKPKFVAPASLAAPPAAAPKVHVPVSFARPAAGLVAAPPANPNPYLLARPSSRGAAAYEPSAAARPSSRHGPTPLAPAAQAPGAYRPQRPLVAPAPYSRPGVAHHPRWPY